MAANYSSTPYASLTALNLAKIKVDGKDYVGSQAYLQWILDNSTDQGFQHVARIRLARLLLETNKLDDAEKLLKGIVAMGFSSEYAELRGDIFRLQGSQTQALENYRLAQGESQPSSQRHQLLQMKIDDLTVKK